MVLYYNIDFLCYNMGYQMHAIRIFFSRWMNSYLS